MILPSESYEKRPGRQSLVGRLIHKLTEKPLSDRSRDVFYYFLYPKVRPFVRKPSFLLDGRSLLYGTQVINLMLATERAVEVPVVLEELEKYTGRSILEIGNVLGHYRDSTNWDVVDKYEEGVNVINEDILDFSPQKQYDFIFSISTIEHIGFNEEVKDPTRIPKALAHIKNNLLAENGVLLATFPLGWNPDLDESFRQGTLPFDQCILMRRIDWANNWEQIDPSQAQYRYGRFIGADYLVIGQFNK